MTPPDDLVKRLRGRTVRSPAADFNPFVSRAMSDPDCVEAADHIEALQAEVARLREALKPFAEEVGRFGRGNDDLKVSIRAVNQKAIPNFDLSVAHFVAARAALASGETQ